jgi:riboflavin synthase
MFTGLIETTGKIVSVTGTKSGSLFGIKPKVPDFFVKEGDSVAIDGVCLTLESNDGAVLFFTAVRETLIRSTLSRAQCGRIVNLERALAVSGRIDGHFVLGHVDGVGRIANDRREGDSIVRRINVPHELCRFMSEKGSVAVDGVSLTISACSMSHIEISFIPYTLEKTGMNMKLPGDEVNIECDVLARYIARLLEIKPEQPYENKGGSILDKMEGLGF